MKKILLLICLLCLLAFSSNAGNVVTFFPVADTACADETCTGFLICQNFEGTGYDNSEAGWSDAGENTTRDADYTGTVLRGSQSASVVQTAFGGWGGILTGFTPQTTVYAFARVRTAGVGAIGAVFTIGDSGWVNDLVSIKSNGVSGYLYCGTVQSTSFTFTNDVTYYVWLDYTKGTGANAVCVAYVSTTRTKPAATVTVANGNATTDAELVITPLVGADDSDSRIIADQVLIKTSDIGTVCE